MHRKNNFDFFRLIFASFVIITHSYPLSGTKDCDWLCQITNAQLCFSYIGVKGFFIISGFLIFQSLERSETIIDYYWKRFLRLFPGLFVVLLLTILLAPFVYEDNSVLYIHNKSMWTYLPNNLILYKTQFVINGIFENNAYKSVVNGSLWTIPYEFTMYILISFLIIFRWNKAVVLSLLIISFTFLAVANDFFYQPLGRLSYILSGKLLLDLGVFFIAGSLLAAIRIEKFRHNNILLIISVLGLLLSIAFNVFIFTKFWFLPVIVILLCIKSTPVINSIGTKIGDLSYGIYIYAFPVQQTLFYYFRFNCLQLMFASFIITFLLAFMSWHLIEKRALKLKKLSKYHSRKK